MAQNIFNSFASFLPFKGNMNTVKFVALNGAMLVLLGPIKIVGYAAISTAVGLCSVFTAKVIDDFIRNDNTPMTGYKWVPRNTTTAYDFLQNKLVDSQMYGQFIKKFTTDASGESISAKAIVEYGNQYLPKVFHLTFPEGFGLNRIVKHTEEGLVAHYAWSAFLPLKQILYDNKDPVDIAVSKIHDFIDHVDILIVHPVSNTYNNVAGLSHLIYEATTSYVSGKNSTEVNNTVIDEKPNLEGQGAPSISPDKGDDVNDPDL